MTKPFADGVMFKTVPRRVAPFYRTPEFFSAAKKHGGLVSSRYSLKKAN
jgi:hypothetical protein